MTTKAAEALYLAQHNYEMEGRGWTVFNPSGKELATLPAIYAFNSGGSPGWYSAVALAEDGTCLGSHVCSAEGYILHDLGVLEGTRLDRHENDYQQHYPDGYRMAYVAPDEVRTHAGLNAAFKLNQEAAKAAERAKS